MKVVIHFRATPARQERQLRQQRARVKVFTEASGMEIVKRFTDTTPDWPQLDRAIAYCREHGTTLLLAHVGRLSQSRDFTSRLVGAEITFLAADDPHFNSETIGILAAIAEKEAIDNSRRTKDRLAEAKRNGAKLGSARPGHWKGREHLRGNLQGSKEAARIRSERTRDYYAFVMPRILQMRKQGASYHDIVTQFNKEGLTTQRGMPYTDVAVMRIIRRYERDTGKKVPSLARARRARRS